MGHLDSAKAMCNLIDGDFDDQVALLRVRFDRWHLARMYFAKDPIFLSAMQSKYKRPVVAM